MNIKDKRITILGAAKSGLSAAKALYKAGAKVFISDIQPEENVINALKRESLLDKVQYEGSGHSSRVLDADFIVLSPGICTDIPILKEAAKRSISVYSEIEMAYRLSKGKRLVVTGSNGKTTTTTLLALFCNTLSNQVFLGGNIGTPVIEFASKTTENSIQVLEVSSFQLETISDFKPDIAIITNFFENHLDRYPNYEAYLKAKQRIALNMKETDTLILNANQPLMHEFAKTVKCKTAWFGNIKEGLLPMLTIIDGRFVLLNKDGAKTELFNTSSVKLIGRHNLENVMAALMAAMLIKADPLKLKKAVEGFSGVEHRLEYAGSKNGATYINDSKATNCAASIIALQACKEPIILIAGGRDKGTDLSDWVNAVRTHAKSVVLFGEAKARFRAALEGLVCLKSVNTLEEAVEEAKNTAQKGDTVLLSPACSSYDLFKSFEARGTRFKELVKAIVNDK